MVRLTDLPDWERDHMLAKLADLEPFESQPWVADTRPLTERRIALITTAGLHRANDRAFAPGTAAADYRPIPADTPGGDLVMSHLSANFDRTGFQEDVNVVFPIDRLNELARDGAIGSAATYHYSFMGAVPIRRLWPAARKVADLLKQDNVDAVLLTPV
jgi:D-proline reductase (dithiol) PrdB